MVNQSAEKLGAASTSRFWSSRPEATVQDTACLSERWIERTKPPGHCPANCDWFMIAAFFQKQIHRLDSQCAYSFNGLKCTLFYWIRYSKNPFCKRREADVCVFLKSIETGKVPFSCRSCRPALKLSASHCRPYRPATTIKKRLFSDMILIVFGQFKLAWD